MDEIPTFDFTTEDGRSSYIKYLLEEFPQLLSAFDHSTEEGRIELTKTLLEGFIGALNERGLNLEEMIELRVILSNETDRGCALMATAYLDQALGNYICASLVDDESVIKTLLGSQGPLGTFSSRIDLSYMLGLISFADRRNLHLIRKIRNDFAHVSTRITFSTDGIASRCRELTNHGFRLPGDSSPRELFLRVVWGLAGRIESSKLRTTHHPMRVDIAPSQ